MKEFVIDDIHGAHLALEQCMERAKFDRKEDALICLGDVCDGWPFVKNCFDDLLKIKNLTYILGNHDRWALQWSLYGWKEDIWLSQGGLKTILSYQGGPMPDDHMALLKNAKIFLKKDNRIFVHGGFDPLTPIESQSPDDVLWDRNLLQQASIENFDNPSFRFGPYEDIFVGHTPTLRFNSIKPLHLCNLWALDTGAGWNGSLTIMNIHTKEYWQSDLVTDLYPNIHGRTK